MNSPTCPWCGDEVDDSPELGPGLEGEHETACVGCGQPVTVRRTVSVDYSCVKREAGQNHPKSAQGWPRNDERGAG
jgi:hypothetical protein